MSSPVERDPALSRRTFFKAAAAFGAGFATEACASSGNPQGLAREPVSFVGRVETNRASEDPKNLAYKFVSALGKGDIESALSTIAPDRQLTPNIKEELADIARALQGCQIGEIVVRENKIAAVAQASVLFKKSCEGIGASGRRISFSGMNVSLETANGRYYVDPWTTRPVIISEGLSPEVEAVNKAIEQIVENLVGKASPTAQVDGSKKEEGKPGRTYVSKEPQLPRAEVDTSVWETKTYERVYDDGKSSFSVSFEAPKGWHFIGFQDDSSPEFIVVEYLEEFSGQTLEEAIQGGRSGWFSGDFPWSVDFNSVDESKYPRQVISQWTQSNTISLSDPKKYAPTIEAAELGDVNLGNLKGKSQAFIIQFPGEEPFWVQTATFPISGNTEAKVFALSCGGSMKRREELKRIYSRMVNTMRLSIRTS